MTEQSVTTKYDEQLLKLENFKKRPFQLPFIGSKIQEENGVLFIMESHYIDPEFFQYQYDKINLNVNEPQLYYNILEKGFTNDFKKYLNTREIIKNSFSKEPKLAKGKSVYRKLASVVHEGMQLKDIKEGDALQHVAIYNYFQRPSYQPAKTIKLCREDKEIAYATLQVILNILPIKNIIFTSFKAYESFKKEDDLKDKKIQGNYKVSRGPHPRIWGNISSYEADITWKEWIIKRMKN